MGTRELSLFADLDQGRLVQSFLSTLQATLPRFVFGDSIPVSFRPLKSNGNNASNPWTEVDLTGKTVRIAIGNPAGAPTVGTFTLTYGGDTTAAIAYNADGATIQAALNALASITAAGGVGVTRVSTAGAFRIVFNTAGARTAITAATESLYPTTGAEIRISVEGSGSAREIVVARLETLPAAFAELADDFPLATSSIGEVRTGAIPVTAADAVAASGILDVSGSGDGDNFTIGSVSFSFVIGATTENEIEPGADETEKAANVISKINAHSTIIAHARVGDPSNAILVTADTAGAAGNTISTPLLFGASTLTGGSDAVTGVIGVSELKTLEFIVLPYSGFYTLEIGGEQTLGIPWNADASTLQAALELLPVIGGGKVTVSGEFPAFTLNFDMSIGDVGAMTIDMTGLVVPEGCMGELDTNTAAMVELLNGASQATAMLEVELYDIADDTTWTVLQTDCTVIDDVIGNSPSSTPAFPSFLTAASIGDTAPVNAVTGVAQVETLTVVAAAGATSSGTLSGNVFFCPSLSINTSVTITLSTATDTTAALIAEKLRTALEADTAINAAFIMTRSGSNVIATRRTPAANDGSFVFSVNAGLGVTAAGSSNTTAGVATVIQTASPPWIRVAGGYLYIEDAGIWKKTALSAL